MFGSRVSVGIGVLALVAILAGPALAESDDAVASEVIAVAKAEWAALNNKDVAGGSKSWVDDCTQFNPGWSTRLEGRDLLVRMSEAQASDSGTTVFSGMANPKVQVYGNTAILTYNYMGINADKDGTQSNQRAKSTRVYVKQDGNWMLVHANFGADPLPE